MSVLDIIKKRRSIRKYMDVAVEWDKVVQILEAGRHAPCSGNVQEWKFVVISEPPIKKKVADACLKQYWIEGAPVLIAICSMVEKQEQFYGDRGKDLYTIQNCAAAAENMLLVATELGLASCWVGAFDENMMCEALSIPSRARPLAVLAFGYADEVVPTPPRTVLESLVYLQSYGNRIKNVNVVLWDWSLQMEKYAQGGKEAAQKGAKKLHEKIKQHLGKIRERMQKKTEE